MATVTHMVTTASSSDTTSYASGAFTPTLGDLLVVFVDALGTNAATPTLSGSTGLTFALITSRLHNGIGVPDRVYMFVANATAAASSQTVTFDCTGDAATGAIIHVLAVSGLTRTGSSAVLQSRTQAGSGSPATVIFNVATDTANPTVACLADDGSTVPAVPSGWTRGGNNSISSPTAASAADYKASGFAATDVTWGAGSLNDWGAIIAELDTSAVVSAIPEFSSDAW